MYTFSETFALLETEVYKYIIIELSFYYYKFTFLRLNMCIVSLIYIHYLFR